MRAELRAELLFESGNNPAAEIGDLRVRERRFAALKRHAHEQRIFPRRNIFASKKIRRLDRMDFADAQRLNRFRHIGKLRTVREQQGKITLDTRKSWQRLIPPRFFRRTYRRVNRIEAQLREENVLPQFQFFRDPPRKLPRDTD